MVRVALDVPLEQLFDYRNDAASSADVGRRVGVPFGRTVTTGIICALARDSEIPPSQLKPIGAIDRSVAPIPSDVIETLRFASRYYQSSFGSALFTALPPVGTSAIPTEHAARALAWTLTDAGRQRLLHPPKRSAPLQQKILERLQAGAITPHCQIGGKSVRDSRIRLILGDFALKGWAAESAYVAHHPAAPEPFIEPSIHLALTCAQTVAAAALTEAAGRFGVHLLFGVTGSGKTTVYARAMQNILRRAEQVLMLVPEINLTPQLETALKSDLPSAHVVVLHSGLTASERRKRWQEAATGIADIVVGTRLAVFSPMPRLGMIVVDEEHDGSFKQAEGLRYHARDVSVWRARARGVPVVLGSATPVLETLNNARSGRYRLLELPTRPAGPMPSIELVDLRRQPRIAAHNPTLSAPLLDALREQLERGEQSLILINRRGYAPVLRCNSCGWAAGCPRCSARLVLHARQRALRCHHCGQCERPPQHCPGCGNPDLTPLGHGTQRLEESLVSLLPEARLLRIDRDSIRGAAAWARAREQIQRREVDLLVGTQMLAKGHDFPRLTLVGVVDSDQTLYSSDFRAPERLFALLTQVSGRAGRADLPGRVLIETALPHHPLFAALIKHDYASFATQLLEERRRLGLPPFSSQAILRADSPALDDALSFLAEARRLAQVLDPAITLYDPVPALLMRRAGRERAQLLVQSKHRGRFQGFLTRWRTQLVAQRQSRVHWILDVDPLEL
ncbi:MAG: primosomal protein N' [Proteobacteria bacterium]|nr:primosomal protein N' [Burkholderiales bacterium]